MHPVQLFDLAAKQAEWLSVRQKIIAGNIANVNTPGFKAREITPFAEILGEPVTMMTKTHAAHMRVANNPLEAKAITQASTLETTHSGNTVVIEDEMLHGSEVAREMSLNTAIVKSFHHMMMSVVQNK